jgi:hypothetical protein
VTRRSLANSCDVSAQAFNSKMACVSPAPDEDGSGGYKFAVRDWRVANGNEKLRFDRNFEPSLRAHWRHSETKLNVARVALATKQGARKRNGVVPLSPISKPWRLIAEPGVLSRRTL